MKIWLIALAILPLLVGCGVWKDYQVGRNSPLEAGELSPQEEAKVITDSVGVVFPPAVAPLLIGLTALFTWNRGRKIRKGLPSSSNPITNHWNLPSLLEGPIQHLASLLTGLFEVGPDESGLKRGWKVLLATGVAAMLLPFIFKIQGVEEFITKHQSVVVGILGILAALISGVEKEVTKVLPLSATGEKKL